MTENLKTTWEYPGFGASRYLRGEELHIEVRIEDTELHLEDLRAASEPLNGLLRVHTPTLPLKDAPGAAIEAANLFCEIARDMRRQIEADDDLYNEAYSYARQYFAELRAQEQYDRRDRR